MDKDALIWYEGAQSSKDEVMGALKELVGKNRDFLVHVSIDKELKKKDFMPLIEAISESGAKMVLTGEPED
jgi:biopolymer transport protein ExbD